MNRGALTWMAGCCLLLGGGCAQVPVTNRPVTNPIQVQSSDLNLVWEKAVDTLHEYQFPILRENRLAGDIETEYKVGAGVLEPWHLDAANAKERWEGTLQSIRRKMMVHIVPTPDGDSFFVSVEAFKELEDLNGIAANSPGGASLRDDRPLRRNLNPVVGQSGPSGWITKGRDSALEQAFLASLMQNVQRR